MRRFPKTPANDSNRSTSPTLLSSNVAANATTTSSNNSGSASNNTNNTPNATFNVNNNVSGTSTFSWSSVAAANSNNATLNRSLQHEPSEKSDVPGSNDSALNPFKYSKEFMIKLYKPVGLPLEFERHEYITSEEPLQPMALIVPTEQEQKLLSGASVNSDLTRRIVSNTTGGVITGGERVERDRVPYSPRNDKHINTGLTSPRGERFGGIIGGVLSGRTSPRSSRPPRTPGSLNPSSDDPIWNGVVTRNAVGTFDSNGVFRIQGNHVDEESLDKSKKDDPEPNKKIDLEFEKKNQADRSDSSDYTKSPQSDNITSKKECSESKNEPVNNVEDTTKTNLSSEELNSLQEKPLFQRVNQHMQAEKEQGMMQGWRELQEQSQQEDDDINPQDEFHPPDEQSEKSQLQQRWHEAEQLSPQHQNHRNSIIKQEKEIEREFERDIDREHVLEQQLILFQQLQLQQEKDKEQHNEKQQLQRQLQLQQHEQEQLQMQRQEQLQNQLRLQQQQLLLQQQQIMQDQQHRQQHIMQQQHQQLLLQHHFDPDQDDDVLKEAFSYPNMGGNTPPMSPPGKTKYSTHSIIGPNSAFGDTNSGVTSLFSSTSLNSESRKQSEQSKWLYRDPSGNIQGPFSSQEMNEWYKGGFFVLSLLVKRVEDAQFEPLGALIRKTGDDERPFSAPIIGNRPSLTISMPNNSSRLVNDPFQRAWGAPNSPSTAQLFLEHQQRFNPFGGTTSVPTTPFDRYQFGGVFGRNETSNGWNDLGTTSSGWGPSEGYTSNGGNLSPRLQTPNSPPLFNNNATFNVSPPQTYLEHQRQLERQQYLMLQQRQLQQNQHTYPDTFIRQQHQNYVGLSGPVSAPITNAPNSPFIDAITRNSGWSTTTEQPPPPVSPWGIIAPGVGATPSRVQQSEDSGYFGIRKDSNFGLQQSTHHERLQTRTNDRSYEVVGGQAQESTFENKAINEVIESMSKLTPVDEKINLNKVDGNFNMADKIELSPKAKLDEPIPQPTQKEEALRSKPSLREIQAEEERKKQHEEKEKTTVISGVSTNNSAGKLPQPLKSSNAAWVNNSPVTPSSPAPWAKDDDHPTQKTPSLREIQEMEARKAVERKAAVTANSHASAPYKDDATTSTTSWGIVVPTSSNESDSSSLSTSPVVTTPAWQSNNTAPKKTLREIQKEEEEAIKKRNKLREMQQAMNISAASGGTTAPNSMGKRYADTVSVGNLNANSKKPSVNSVTNAWTTVASKTSARVTTTTPTNINLNSKTNMATKDASLLDSEHKPINGVQTGLRAVNQSAKPTETLKSGTRTTVNMGISKPMTTSGNNNNNGNISSFSECSTPRPPSEEFLKWCRNALRGLNNVNVDEFIHVLLTFPLDPPPETVEIIQESIYANSPTLDGRRFADEFIKRRKADANGLPMNSLLSHHSDSKPNKDLTNGSNGAKDDFTGNGAGAFKVVTTKKSKKNKH
ncbi:17473_t:CDS:2 [Gigaspora margarita]|uniref:17473_t:CDS:1 n=1 Tax=Gigaspora margarita TaxID=4874 RepID=A0ABM8W3J2_GIGMA|nr:17473_t:CDS:2 [Gigaspora margarita]